MSGGKPHASESQDSSNSTGDEESPAVPTAPGASIAPPGHQRRRRMSRVGDPTASKRRRKSDDRPSFPAILMGILSNPKYADTISFLSDERRFIVVNPIELETTVLPLHFDASPGAMTCERFVNMLCKWGFQIYNDAKYPDINVYSHPLFKKGDWEGCLRIVKPSKSANETSSADNDDEAPMPELPSDQYDNARSVSPSHEARHKGCNSGNDPSSHAALNHVETIHPKVLEAQLLQKMEVTNASRRLSGIGMNRDPMAMRMFLQHQMAGQFSAYSPHVASFRRSSLPFFPGWNGPGDMMYAMQQPQIGFLQQMQKAGETTGNALGENVASETNENAPGCSGKRGSQQEGESEANNEKGLPGDDGIAATNKIVSDAMAALKGEVLSHQIGSSFRRHSMEHINTSPSYLNAMTEQFLQRSMARRLGSRPSGMGGLMNLGGGQFGTMFGPSMMYGNFPKNDPLMAEVGAKVDAQARVLLAQRRRESLDMSKKMASVVDKDDSSSKMALSEVNKGVVKNGEATNVDDKSSMKEDKSDSGENK
ncbi:hypothetical protein HJC23_007977 [Cyclotella cryptica]|uniref:HSF-type DNA-binding domain-containing protein n=1 Tax=Cyclotella cryptica TaxID=29204 RepID=A0ABD3P8E8_9STRA|eukprot:CCRYP_016937-RA/>CCRYP_016937-RA protein AED:0.10 eAED:0.10 QI:0/-1/0/1/-1/1/1/0/537